MNFECSSFSGEEKDQGQDARVKLPKEKEFLKMPSLQLMICY
jgi:hypothetical protein